MSLTWAEIHRLSPAGSVLGLRRVLLAAPEAERVALAAEATAGVKSAGSRSWWEGPDRTPGYALAVIGCMPSAAQAAALLGRSPLRGWGTIPVDLFLEIARARELPWLGDLAVRLTTVLNPRERWLWEWAFVDALLREAGTPPPVTEWVVRNWLVQLEAGSDRDGYTLAGGLRESPYLDLLLPAVFEIDGPGAELTGGRYDEAGNWDPALNFPGAVAELVAEGRLDRPAVLAATVDRLVRGDRAAWLRPFTALHDALTPTVDELAGFTADYVRLLGDAPSPVATLAQRTLRALDDAGRLPVETLIEAGEAALSRTEKGLVKAQLGWLDRAARRERSATVLETMAGAFTHPSLDLQERALNSIERQAGLLDDAATARMAEASTALTGGLRTRAGALFGGQAKPVWAPQLPTPSRSAPADSVPSSSAPPHSTSSPPPPMPPPIASAAELAEELVVLLYDGSAVRWERVLAGLVTLAGSGQRVALKAALEPALDREGSAAHWYFDLTARALAVAVSKIVAPQRRDGIWARLHCAAEAQANTRARPMLVGPPADLLRLRAAEIAERLAASPMPVLLATPTHVTGSLDAEVLLDRLTRLAEAGLEPWLFDFEQALLRVPREVDDGVRVRAEALGSPAGRRFAEWLAQGGLPDPVSTRHQQRDRPSGSRSVFWTSPERRVVATVDPAPVDPARTGLSEIMTRLITVTRRETVTYYATELTDLGVRGDVLTMALPHHREVCAAWALPDLASMADQDFPGGGEVLPLLADCSGPIGPAMSLAVAYTLGARQRTDRAAAVDAFLALTATPPPVPSGAPAAPGTPTAVPPGTPPSAPGSTLAAAVGADLGDLCADGSVKLTRVVPALTEAHRAGASPAVWDLLQTALPPLLQATPRGLPDLLELATQVVATVAATGEIKAVTEVAARTGGTRLIREARRLRDTLSPAKR